MASEIKGRDIKTVNNLKKFLDGIKDNVRVSGTFEGDGVRASLWKSDNDESGPRLYVTIETY